MENASTGFDAVAKNGTIVHINGIAPSNKMPFRSGVPNVTTECLLCGQENLEINQCLSCGCRTRHSLIRDLSNEETCFITHSNFTTTDGLEGFIRGLYTQKINALTIMRQLFSNGLGKFQWEYFKSKEYAEKNTHETIMITNEGNGFFRIKVLWDHQILPENWDHKDYLLTRVWTTPLSSKKTEKQ